ncbi:MAG: type II toxin-antitoxin system VapC family toxin [Acidobacteriia bacterium]|nr:type II toxin-antitoxin system VapC family toxin [Terriglobia bacterium]
MKLLLDTHIWIWSVSDPQRLSRRVAKALEDVQNQLWLSPVSIWEALLLHRKGRLRVPEGFSTWVTRALTTMPLTEAPLNFEVAAALSAVSLPHADPADHFLAASAKAFGLTLITSDRNLVRTKEISVMEN